MSEQSMRVTFLYFLITTDWHGHHVDLHSEQGYGESCSSRLRSYSLVEKVERRTYYASAAFRTMETGKHGRISWACSAAACKVFLFWQSLCAYSLCCKRARDLRREEVRVVSAAKSSSQGCSTNR